MLKIPCLVLDHDDTVVQSTPAIHYPSFVKTLQSLRPDIQWSLQEFVQYNFEPGFEAMCRDILQFNDDEMRQQENRWHDYSERHQPPMFDGMADFLKAYKQQGGFICVVSHSSAQFINRDYNKNCGFEPDLVFDWHLGAEKRKPNPWPLEEIMRKTGFASKELLMVDDLKPGLAMARSCNVPAAFAGWGCSVPALYEQITPYADYSLCEIKQLAALALN